MKGMLSWAIFVVYGLLLVVMSHFGLQHIHFFLFIVLLFIMSLAALWGISLSQGKDEKSESEERFKVCS